MPVSSGKSTLFEQFGNKLLQAHQEHANDETKVDSFGDLPAGIVGGVAQVTKVWFDTYKKGKNSGKPYYMAMATVKRPVVAPDGSMIEGLTTKIGPIPICDTPDTQGQKKTLSDHLKDVYDEFRKMGVDTKTLDPRNLEVVASLLTKAKPHIRFRTWKGTATSAFPNPSTQHTWIGTCTFSENGAPHVEESPEEAVDETSSQPAEGDLAALVASAEAGDDDAAAKLTSLALSAGVHADNVQNATSWTEVGELIDAVNKLLPVDADPSASNGSVKVGSCWYYKPPKMKKAVECEVTSVDGNDCALRRLDNGLVYPKVAVSSLQPNP